jgi:hypothetical protein
MEGLQMSTRYQQRLQARFDRAQMQFDIRPNPVTLRDLRAARDAHLGDAIYRRNQTKITPLHAAVRRKGIFAAARQAKNLGIDFVDFYVGLFGVMPRIL